MTTRRMTAGSTCALGVGLLALAALPAAAQSDGKAEIWRADDAGLEWSACPEFMPEGCGIALLAGDPAGDDADIFFRVPGGSTIDRHWHGSAERMVLVAGEMQVEYDDQEPVTLRPGTYAYGPAEAPHSAECLSEEACVLFIAFESKLDAIAGGPE